MAFGIEFREPMEVAEVKLNEMDEFKNQQKFVTDTIRNEIDNTSTKIAKLDDYLRTEVSALKDKGFKSAGLQEVLEISADNGSSEGGTVSPRGRGAAKRSRFRYRNFGNRNSVPQGQTRNMGAEVVEVIEEREEVLLEDL